MFRYNHLTVLQIELECHSLRHSVSYVTAKNRSKLFMTLEIMKSPLISTHTYEVSVFTPTDFRYGWAKTLGRDISAELSASGFVTQVSVSNHLSQQTEKQPKVVTTLFECHEMVLDLFVKGSAASKSLYCNSFRDTIPLLAGPLTNAAHSTRSCPDVDMSVDGWEHENELGTVADHYELGMAPERLTTDLPIQITVFVYAYAKLHMLQLWYNLLGVYKFWESLYTDTNSYYISLGANSLHDCLCPERSHAFYERSHNVFGFVFLFVEGVTFNLSGIGNRQQTCWE